MTPAPENTDGKTIRDNIQTYEHMQTNNQRLENQKRELFFTVFLGCGIEGAHMKGSSMGDDVVIFLWMTIFEEKKKI